MVRDTIDKDAFIFIFLIYGPLIYLRNHLRSVNRVNNLVIYVHNK